MFHGDRQDRGAVERKQHKVSEAPALRWGGLCNSSDSYCWKHSHSTEYWCQMQSRGDKNSLLCWDGQHADNIFFIVLLQWPEKNNKTKSLPIHVAANVQYKWGCNSMHAKCKALHSLAFLKPIACAFLAIALLSSDSFVMHYCTCLHLNKEVIFFSFTTEQASLRTPNLVINKGRAFSM